MATSVTFKLKEPKSDKETLIYLIFRFNYYQVDKAGNKIYRDLKYSTGLKWNPEHWDFKAYRGIDKKTFPDPTELNQSLKNIETAVEDIYRRLVNDGNEVTPELIKQELERREDLFPDIKTKRIKEKAEVVNIANPIVFLERYIQEVTTIYKNGKPFPITSRTRQKYNTTFRHLKDFVGSRGSSFTFKDIDLKFYEGFVEYLRTKAKKPPTKRNPNPKPIQMGDNTVGKHISTLKTFLRVATENGMETNPAYESNKFAVMQEEVEKIYLNVSELEGIYTLQLSKRLEPVRDLFLIGCYTALRYSDYVNLHPENVYSNDTGSFLKVTTQKGSQKVVIPIHWIVKEIIEKYQYNLPKAISNQKMNDYLKEIGKLAEIVVPVSITKLLGGVRTTSTLPKYKLISTHTARRSGATNMFLAGIPAISIMKITGHKTERAFMKYIRMTSEDNANKLQEHSFFKDNRQAEMKVVS